MNIFQSAFLGIIEGITEFLPISSTFHLIWTSTLLNLSQSDFIKLFEVVIQAGAIFAVVLLYFKEVLKSRELMVKIMATFLPTAAIGFVLYKFIKGFFFENLLLTTSVFIVIGLVFILIEQLVSKKKLKLDKK
jgi:undecaprenyl-diphosphatase